MEGHFVLEALFVQRRGGTVRGPYRDTSFIRKIDHPGPYSRTMTRALWWSEGGVLFLMSEVPLSFRFPQGDGAARCFTGAAVE